MKKILKFLPIFICLCVPDMAVASGDCGAPTGQCPSVGECTSFCGCYNTNIEGSTECDVCSTDTYNDGYSMAQECKQCTLADNPYNQQPNNYPGKIFDVSSSLLQQLGKTFCPWVCDTGYYRSSYNENTGAGECKQCGDDWTGCENAGATSATVGCPSGSYKTINSSTGVVTCTPCGRYAFVRNNNECVCKGNTYGNPYEGCTKCPAGMLTVVNTSAETAIHDPNFQGEPGATEKSQCKIGAFTKFCNGNGTHCMRLMQ